MQLIYAGDTVQVKDPDTGEVVTAEVVAIHHSDPEDDKIEFVHVEWRTGQGDLRSNVWLCPARGDFIQWLSRRQTT